MKKLVYLWIATCLGALSLGDNARAEEPWHTYKGCVLIPNASNDGDSFHVRAEGHEYIFRLYFVDTPETENTFPARVAAQAKYFHLTVPQTLDVGIAAEQFTRQKLSRPFTVITRKQDARGESRLPRFFAILEIDNENLAEDLIANGLARVYGAKAQAPATKPVAAEESTLHELEQTAKAQRLGGWGVVGKNMNLHAAVPSVSATPSGSADSFDAFFHTTPAPSSAQQTAGKLDINHASSEALQNLPGIGPALAARIIAARPFQSADELGRVPGIGAKKYAVLRSCFQ